MMVAVQRHGTVATFTRAETIPGLREELDAKPEVILCAHNVSQAPLEAALRIVREHDPDLPFIIVSGPVVDEHTASFLTSGASAMVRKDRLHMLAPVIERELDAARVRRSHRELQAGAAGAEKRFRALVERSVDGILIAGRDARVQY